MHKTSHVLDLAEVVAEVTHSADPQQSLLIPSPKKAEVAKGTEKDNTGHNQS